MSNELIIREGSESLEVKVRIDNLNLYTRKRLLDKYCEMLRKTKSFKVKITVLRHDESTFMEGTFNTIEPVEVLPRCGLGFQGYVRLPSYNLEAEVKSNQIRLFIYDLIKDKVSITEFCTILNDVIAIGRVVREILYYLGIVGESGVEKLGLTVWLCNSKNEVPEWLRKEIEELTKKEDEFIPYIRVLHPE